MSNPRKLVFRIVIILLMAITIPLRTNQAQGGIEVQNATATVSFGKSITFTANIKSPLSIKQASLLIRDINDTVTRVETVQVAADGSVNFTYDAALNMFPPFSQIVFWFQVTLKDDKTYTSEPVTFSYNDNRFPWREMTRSNVTVYWYAGDDLFGSAALDATAQGMLAINEFVPVSQIEPVNIYIYSNISDLQSTLMLGGEEWQAGTARPELGVVLVAIAPGSSQSSELKMDIPHELTHMMLYHSLGNKYHSQPMWLLEGIASMMELSQNPNYTQALEGASQNNLLLPFADLCASFPADAGNAFLAFAQSQSFVTYIRETYGTSGLGRLTSAYGEGFPCELGATSALGTPLSQLDSRWRESVLGQNVAGVAARNLIPFFLLMVLVLVVPIWGAIDMLLQRRKRAVQPK